MAPLVTNSKIKRKWQFIADRLEEVGAPKEVINAARVIDITLISVNGEHAHTTFWVREYEVLPYTYLSSVVSDATYCNFCASYDGCKGCPLDKPGSVCSPDYGIVSDYLGTHKVKLYGGERNDCY